MDASPVSAEVARRFLLGRQGLWPGRRWGGRKGVDEALRYVGSVQVDSLNVVGRSQDLALGSRVDGYQLDDLPAALYERHTLFEWGGNLRIRPVEALPFLRLVMERKVEEKRWREFARTKAALIARVRREVEQRGPLGSQDFGGKEEAAVESYRAGKEPGLALYYLWLKGELMVASRRGGEKLFDLTERLFPRATREVPVVEAEEHLLLQTLRELGLSTGTEWLAHGHTVLGRTVPRREWTEWTRRLRERGLVQEVEVDGWTGRRWFVADGAADLESLRSADVPRGWRPRSTTTEQEAVFLAPLETATARGRALPHFSFEYVWEVYKPESARRWGYYTLPLLYGDRLRARADLRFDPPTRSLRVLGFWWEDREGTRDPRFWAALGRGLKRLGGMVGATSLDLRGIRPVVARAGILRGAV